MTVGWRGSKEEEIFDLDWGVKFDPCRVSQSPPDQVEKSADRECLMADLSLFDLFLLFSTWH